MKKVTLFNFAIAGIISFTAPMNSTILAQTVQKIKYIPVDVLMIVKQSCINCHSDPENPMALSHVKLSKWDSYTAEKQAANATAMCNILTFIIQYLIEINQDYEKANCIKKQVVDWYLFSYCHHEHFK